MKTIHELIEEYLEHQDKSLMTQILEQIKTEEHLWAVLARVTNNFYMGIEHEKPAAYLFTDRQYADEFMRDIKWEGIQVKALEIRPEQRANFFSDLYRSGVECICVDKGEDSVEFSLAMLIEAPDMEKNPEFVINPTLLRAAAQFYQGLAGKRAVKEMQDLMCTEIKKARFLLPVNTFSLKEGELKEGSLLVEYRPGLSYPELSAQNGGRFLPIFSDWVEFGKFDKKRQYAAAVVKFEMLKRLVKKADGIALNPFGFNLIMDQEKILAIDAER